MENVLGTELMAIFSKTWPTLLITCVVLITIRFAYIIINKKEFYFYKELFGLLFVIYIMMLFHAVTYQDANTGGTNLIPFIEIFRYKPGSSLFFKNIIGNIFIFVPFGFFVSYFIKTKKITPVIIVTFITSLTIEATQLGIGRIFDVDDIILNVIGGIIGFYLYKMLSKVNEILPEKLKKAYIYNIILVALLLLFALYFYSII